MDMRLLSQDREITSLGIEMISWAILSNDNFVDVFRMIDKLYNVLPKDI